MPWFSRYGTYWKTTTRKNKKLKKKKLIKRILVLSAWFLVICGLATLLIAANRKQKDHVCHALQITMKGGSERYFIEKADVQALMESAAGGKLEGRSVARLDLRRLERTLEANDWIRNAELYFDNKDVLRVTVEEREPVARVFTTLGSSFYIDSSGHKMPLLDKVSARLPVVTHFISPKRMKYEDSLLLDDTRRVCVFIGSHPFWNAQIGQIDVTLERKFELIPVIGDHIIRIGRGEQIEDQLNRLYVFYQQVLSKVGFNKYAALDLQYKGQVVAVSKEPVSPVDSLQLQKNIEELMQRASLQNVDSDMMPQPATLAARAIDSSHNMPLPAATQVNNTQTRTQPAASANANPNTPVQATRNASVPKPAPVRTPRTIRPQPHERQTETRRPKAVMTRRG